MGNKDSKTRGPYAFLCCHQWVKLAEKAEQEAFPSYSGWIFFFSLMSIFFRKKIYVCEVKCRMSGELYKIKHLSIYFDREMD